MRYLYGSSGDVGAGSYERSPVLPETSDDPPVTPPAGSSVLLDQNRIVLDSKSYTINAAAPIAIGVSEGPGRVLESRGRQRPA